MTRSVSEKPLTIIAFCFGWFRGFFYMFPTVNAGSIIMSKTTISVCFSSRIQPPPPAGDIWYGIIQFSEHLGSQFALTFHVIHNQYSLAISHILGYGYGKLVVQYFFLVIGKYRLKVVPFPSCSRRWCNRYDFHRTPNYGQPQSRSASAHNLFCIERLKNMFQICRRYPSPCPIPIARHSPFFHIFIPRIGCPDIHCSSLLPRHHHSAWLPLHWKRDWIMSC